MPSFAADRKVELERRLAGPDGTVMVVAHRACWQGTSENSIDAIEACIAAGVDMVELDVRATRDGKLVLMHDPSVDRMTDGTGMVADLDWKRLRKLRLREGGGRGSPLTGRRIPTFEQALRTARNRILINVDAKAQLSAKVRAMIDAQGMRRQVLFKAEAPPATILEAAPWARSVPFQPILREPYITDPAGQIAAYDALRPVSFEIDVKTEPFAPVITPIVHARCARYWIDALAGRVFDDRVPGVDPAIVWDKLVALGVDAVQTDEPIALKAHLLRTGASAYRCEPAPAP
ncbi:MAG TPA: glycerophosphodiester phosphodiesterase family protein [Novosphingobium sp.]|nr:glycerophosphodiester phosphodiesterase family protein [Novosphingobium sp.]